MCIRIVGIIATEQPIQISQLQYVHTTHRRHRTSVFTKTSSSKLVLHMSLHFPDLQQTNTEYDYCSVVH